MAADQNMSQVDILRFLCSHVKLERDRGLAALEQKLREPDGLFGDEKSLIELQSSLIHLCDPNGSEWEAKQGGLLGTKLIILDGRCSEEFCETVRNVALNLMHDVEARVRLASGK